MAFGTGVIEVADSEEEPLTSSPAAVSDAHVDKLSATACQDAQATLCPHQEYDGSIADEASSRTDALGIDQEKPLSNVETTQIDHVDVQPAPHAETNTLSTGTAKGHAQVITLSSQASVAAISSGYQASSTDVDVADDEIKPAQFLKETPEIGDSLQHDGLELPSTHLQVKLSGSLEQEQQPSLPDSLSAFPIHVGAEQVNASNEQPQTSSLHGNASVSHAVMPGSESNESANLGSYQPGLSHWGATMSHRTNPGDADSEAVALHPIAHEASVEPPVCVAEESPNFNLDTNRSSPQIRDTSESTYSDPTLAAANLVTLHAPSARNAGDAASPSPERRDDRKTLESFELALTTSSTAAAVLPVGVRPTLSTNASQVKVDDDGMVPSIIADEDIAVNTHDPRVERCRNNMTLENEAQDLTQGHVETTRMQINEQPGVAATHQPRNIGNKNMIRPNLMVMASATQTQSKFTASQANESASARPAISMTPQEITLAELKAQKAALLASLGDLPAIRVLIEEHASNIELSDDDGEPTDADITAAANKIVKDHIKLLHEYNELKDVGQGLMGLIADQRGVRIVEVQDEFGIDAND